jgi:hypothetical protein
VRNSAQKNRASVFTCITGKNDELIANAAQLYIHNGDRVLDVTYGKGVFWKRIDRTKIDLVTNALVTTADSHCGFRSLAFANASFDHTVFDPPYVHDGKTVMIRKRYNNHVTTAKMNYEGIIQMYEEGVRECVRVTKVGGYIWIKVQDQVENHRQRWSHFHLELMGRTLGLSLQDQFILCNGRPHV